MAVSIKSAREIELMREAGKRLAHVHQELEAMIAPGISTWEIDAKGEKLIRDCGCIPNFLHYNGYPASICVSVNDEVVHGIPRKDRYLKEGDIVSLDAGLSFRRGADTCGRQGEHRGTKADGCNKAKLL